MIFLHHCRWGTIYFPQRSLLVRHLFACKDDVFVEIEALPGGGNVTSTDDVIAEFFAFGALSGVAFEDRGQCGCHVTASDVFFVEFVEPLAGVSSTEIEVVFSGAFPNKSDFCDKWTAAAVRATRHSDGDGIVSKACFFQGSFNLPDEIGEIALCFGESETAGR